MDTKKIKKFESLNFMLQGGVKLETALILLNITQEEYEEYLMNKHIDIPEIFKEIFNKSDK